MPDGQFEYLTKEVKHNVELTQAELGVLRKARKEVQESDSTTREEVKRELKNQLDLIFDEPSTIGKFITEKLQKTKNFQELAKNTGYNTDYVALIQLYLNCAGYNVDVDGILSENGETHKAIKTFNANDQQLRYQGFLMGKSLKMQQDAKFFTTTGGERESAKRTQAGKRAASYAENEVALMQQKGEKATKTGELLQQQMSHESKLKGKQDVEALLLKELPNGTKAKLNQILTRAKQYDSELDQLVKIQQEDAKTKTLMDKLVGDEDKQQMRQYLKRKFAIEKYLGTLQTQQLGVLRKHKYEIKSEQDPYAEVKKDQSNFVDFSQKLKSLKEQYASDLKNPAYLETLKKLFDQQDRTKTKRLLRYQADPQNALITKNMKEAVTLLGYETNLEITLYNEFAKVLGLKTKENPLKYNYLKDPLLQYVPHVYQQKDFQAFIDYLHDIPVLGEVLLIHATVQDFVIETLSNIMKGGVTLLDAGFGGSNKSFDDFLKSSKATLDAFGTVGKSMLSTEAKADDMFDNYKATIYNVGKSVLDMLTLIYGGGVLSKGMKNIKMLNIGKTLETMKISDSLGLVGASLILHTGPELDKALQGFGKENLAQAGRRALLSSGLQSVLELVSPNKIMRGPSKDLATLLTKENIGNVTMRKNMTGKLLSEMGKENGQEVMQLMGDKRLQTMTNVVENKKIFDAVATPKEIKEMLFLTTVTTGLVSGPGVKKAAAVDRMRGTFIETLKSNPGEMDAFLKNLESKKGEKIALFGMDVEVNLDEAKIKEIKDYLEKQMGGQKAGTEQTKTQPSEVDQQIQKLEAKYAGKLINGYQRSQQLVEQIAAMPFAQRRELANKLLGRTDKNLITDQERAVFSSVHDIAPNSPVFSLSFAEKSTKIREGLGKVNKADLEVLLDFGVCGNMEKPLADTNKAQNMRLLSIYFGLPDVLKISENLNNIPNENLKLRLEMNKFLISPLNYKSQKEEENREEAKKAFFKDLIEDGTVRDFLIKIPSDVLNALRKGGFFDYEYDANRYRYYKPSIVMDQIGDFQIWEGMTGEQAKLLLHLKSKHLINFGDLKSHPNDYQKLITIIKNSNPEQLQFIIDTLYLDQHYGHQNERLQAFLVDLMLDTITPDQIANYIKEHNITDKFTLQGNLFDIVKTEQTAYLKLYWMERHSNSGSENFLPYTCKNILEVLKQIPGDVNEVIIKQLGDRYQNSDITSLFLLRGKDKKAIAFLLDALEDKPGDDLNNWTQYGLYKGGKEHFKSLVELYDLFKENLNSYQFHIITKKGKPENLEIFSKLGVTLQDIKDNENLIDKIADKVNSYGMPMIDNIEYLVDKLGFVLKDASYDNVISIMASGKIENLQFLTEKLSIRLQDIKDNVNIATVVKSGKIENLQYLTEELGVTLQDIKDNNYNIANIIQIGKIDNIKYLIEKLGFRLQDLNEDDNYNLGRIIELGEINNLKYLTEELGVRLQDLKSDYNIRNIIVNGKIDNLQYLNEKLGIRLQDIKDNANIAVVVQSGRIDNLQYLTEKFDITLQDIKSDYNIRNIIVDGKIDNIKHLVEKSKMRLKDIEDNNRVGAIIQTGKIENLQFLTEKLGITLQDIKDSSTVAWVIEAGKGENLQLLYEYGLNKSHIMNAPIVTSILRGAKGENIKTTFSLFDSIDAIVGVNGDYAKSFSKLLEEITPNTLQEYVNQFDQQGVNKNINNFIPELIRFIANIQPEYIKKNDFSFLETIGDKKLRKELFGIALSNDIEILKFASYYNVGISNINIQNITTDDLKLYLKENLIPHGFFSEEKYSLLFTKNQRIDNVGYFFGKIFNNKELEHQKIGESQKQAMQRQNKLLYTLSKDTGLDLKHLYDIDHSEKTLQDFFTTIIGISKQSRSKELFSHIALDPEMAKKNLPQLTAFFQKLQRLGYILDVAKGKLPGFTELFVQNLGRWSEQPGTQQSSSETQRGNHSDSVKSFAQNLKKRTEGSPEGLPERREQIRTPLTLSLQNISTLGNDIDYLFVHYFSEVFKIKDKEITAEQIAELENKRGNLDVLYTLIARYSGSENWKKEIPLFTRVVEKTLDGQFHKLKYEGYEGDLRDQEQCKKQLSGLEGKALEARKNNPHALTVFSTQEQSDEGEVNLLSKAQAEFLEQTIGYKHLDLIQEGLTEEIKNLTLQNFTQEQKTLFLTEKNINKILEGMTGETKKEKARQLTKLCLTVLKESTVKEEFEKALSILKQGVPGLNLTAMKNDLAGIQSKLEVKVQGNEAILFTTVIDDPKLLLSIGDLVNATSCQNYKTGGMIQTLLGYVVDANVKGVLSFAITPKECGGNPRTYELIKKAIQSGSYTIEFNAAKLQLRINNIPIQLDKAFARRIMKLGVQPDGKPGLFLERTYYQNHFAEQGMQKEIENIGKNMANSIGGDLVKENAANAQQTKIRFTGSRNPGGVYSDGFGGVKIGDYGSGE